MPTTIAATAALAPAFASPLALLPHRPAARPARAPRRAPRPAPRPTTQVRRPRASLIPERPPDGYKDTCPFGSNSDDLADLRAQQRDAARRAAARGQLGLEDASGGAQQPPLFVDEPGRQAFWQKLDVASTFAPVTPEEAEQLRRLVPRRFADFLLDRAADAARLRDGPAPDDQSFVARVLRDLPPDVPDWADDGNWEYAQYQYATAAGPPSFRRRGSSLFGGGDGLPDPDDDGLVGEPHDPADDVRQGREPLSSPDDPPTWQARRRSLFVGQSDSVDEQASRVGYSILAVIGLWIFIKLLLALVSFFVSFTFSFFAIFALSAGIFVVFFLLRF